LSKNDFVISFETINTAIDRKIAPIVSVGKCTPKIILLKDSVSIPALTIIFLNLFSFKNVSSAEVALETCPDGYAEKDSWA